MEKNEINIELVSRVGWYCSFLFNKFNEKPLISYLVFLGKQKGENNLFH